jgi:7-keto-8-aminopelargonate synthetase-like enzyme
VQQASATTLTIDGRELLAFTGCNYLALAWHPAVQRALHDGLARYGLTTSSSRETTGNTTLHDELDASVARFCGAEAAAVVPEGFAANLAMAQTLAARGVRTAVIDERSHRSLRTAAEAAGLRVVLSPHLDHTGALRLLRECAGDDGTTVAFLTDGVFTADGSMAPAREVLAALPEGATLVVDDCHGLFAMGPGARGTLAHLSVLTRADADTGGAWRLRDERDVARLVITSTMAKGLGCYGGFVAGSAEFIATLRRHAGAYIGTTPAPPPMAAAALEALRVIDREPGLLASLARNVQHTREVFTRLGLPVPVEPSPIFYFTLAPAGLMERLRDDMLAAGLFVPLIEYPGAAEARYFRVTVNASHTPEQIERLGRELARCLPRSAVVLSRAV